jgi:surface polysaccharide O-acyltransferase-like enzyme
MPASRNASLDALRVLSLLGIITLHVAGGGFNDNKALAFVLDELSRFAVPAFFILSAWFWKPDELASPLRLTLRVASRVLPAFLLWTSIFVLLKQLPHLDRPVLDYSPAGLLLLLWTGGPAFHLWFLPALVVSTALVALAGRHLGWGWTLALSLLLFVAGTIVGAYAKPLFGHGFPFWMDRNGLFFGPVFLTLGVLLRRHRKTLATLPMWGITAAALAFAVAQIGEGYFIVGRYPMGHDYSLATLGYAVAVVLLFSRLDLRAPVFSTLGKATFTAYLVHPLILNWLVMTLQVKPSGLVILLCLAIALAIGMAWQAARGALSRNEKARIAAGPSNSRLT